ncbi:MAG: glycoside hydrolase family 99-like domain-containing protein [Armatimonadota bacterium]
MLRPATLLLLFMVAPLYAAPQVLKEWNFDTAGNLEGWASHNHMKAVTATGGAMQGELTDWDPFIKSPQFEIAANPWQAVEIRLKTDCGGQGAIFWTNTTSTPYEGFSPGKETHFTVIGDNQWHDYRLYPYWQGEKKIILLRLDLPSAHGGGKSFAVDSLRIVDLGAQEPVKVSDWDLTKGGQGWTALGGGEASPGKTGLAFDASGDGFELRSPPLKLDLDERYNVHLMMTVKNASGGSVVWATQTQSGVKRQSFPLRDDGKPHVYNLDLSGSAAWAGEALLLGLSLPKGATGTVQRVAITDQPLGPADVEVTGLIVDTALPRSGQNIPLLLSLRNNGGATATGLKIVDLTAAGGVLEVPDKLASIPALPGGETLNYTIKLRSLKAGRAQVSLHLTGQGAPGTLFTCTVNVLPSLNLPKASYVPQPKPVKSDYEIGAYYFPGWQSGAKWEPVRRVAPIRKPVLGWYDESNPECVDWQIKWAVEHGISYFMVDWYWSAGNRSLEHWLKAYEQAKYRKYLKWCVMWANHNAPNTHSEADQRAVTKFWIDNYFKMPEYYRIGDMPVIIMWSPGNLRRDLGGSEAVKKALETSQQMSREAGYKGIYFMSMAGEDPKAVQQLKDEGYAETTSYHYMGHGGKAADPRRFTFDLVADSSLGHWQNMAKTPLPFLPNLATGWDARPWLGENTVVITGRTVPLFRRICEDAKRFADQTGIKRLSLAPLNEWGEGSYLEPCQEFGFEMYDVVRDVFCKTDGPCQQNYGPSDVGLGPYDFKDLDLPSRQAWDFTDGAQGWGGLMGVRDYRAKDGIVSFTTVSNDPAITVRMPGLIAANLSKLTIRMKMEGVAGEQTAQLFWSSGDQMTEGHSTTFKVITDGQWHDHVIDLKALPRWRGKIRSLRFDPGSVANANVSIEEIKFE